jgi:uncharacterized membrane protein
MKNKKEGGCLEILGGGFLICVILTLPILLNLGGFFNGMNWSGVFVNLYYIHNPVH